MKIGIKVGLLGDARQDLLQTRPDFCEIWFHSRKIDQYNQLFATIAEVGCENGLHFWGALDDQTLANLSYPDTSVLSFSRNLVMKSIDAAAKNHSWYVNVHPGGALLGRVDFEAQQFIPYGKKVSFETCADILAESMSKLASYAADRGVQMYVESVPHLAIGHPWYGTEGRKKPVELAELPIRYLQAALEVPNVFFTNDFGHTASNLIDTTRSQIIEYLQQITVDLAPQTKLLHVGYIVPPYNGTDYHGCLYYDELKTDVAVPNYQEINKLLALFLNRPDVGALVEPETNHPGNFQTLKALVYES
jgi:sugar phosphate isomerase/epimerase